VCLEYHIKNCEGPCVGLESEASYDEKIAQVKNILKGNFAEVRRHFKAEMERLAEAMDFERAQQIKEKLTAFEDYQSKSTIVSTSIRDVDVFGLALDDKEAYLNYIKIVNGAVIHTHTQEITMNLDDDAESLLTTPFRNYGAASTALPPTSSWPKTWSSRGPTPRSPYPRLAIRISSWT
jgi:excinuclease ABC subunit C